MSFRVLIVDDERMSRSYIRNMALRIAPDLLIFEASSAGQALDCMEERSFDILFLDIQMPEVNGIQLLEQVSSRPSELIFITAHPQYAIRAIREGASDYLLKPIRKAAFRETLLKTIDRLNKKAEDAAFQEKIRGELWKANASLQAYAADSRAKSEKISELQAEIERIGSGVKDVPPEQITILEKLRKATILTEDDWLSFKELFEKVHRHFFVRLKETYSDLSPAETRLFALIRLDLSTKEMATMLGVSPETIRQTKWRMRKKMNLPEYLALEEVASRFSN